MPTIKPSKLRKHWLGAEDGSVLVITAFGATMLMGCMALSVDAGRILLAQRQMQAFADAAAMAGALEINTCGTTTNCAAMQNAAQAAAQEVGASSVTIVTQCGSTSGDTGLVVQLNNGPCALGTSDPNHGSANYVEAVVGEQVPTIFGNVLGQSTFNVQARSEAGGPGTPSACIYALDKSASNAVTFNGGTLSAINCGIQIDSSASSAMVIDSGATVSVKSINIVGSGYTKNGGSLNVTPQVNQAYQSDPLASLPTPASTPCGTSTSSPYTGAANNISVGSAVTLKPGVYCGGVNFNSGTYTVTLSGPGNFIFTGSVNVGSGVTINGSSGVLLYFKSGTLQLNSNSTADLVAQTTGTYAGVLYFQDRSNSSGLDLDSGTSSVIQGFIYAPDAAVTLNSDSSVSAYNGVVADTVIINSGANFTMGANYSSLPNGSPIKSSSGVSNLAMVE
jgi:Flp pilus assembly protein TadG